MGSPGGEASTPASGDRTAAGDGAAIGAAALSPSANSVWRWRPSRAAVVVFLTGLLVTAALALTSLGLYDRNENRLLGLRVRELSLVLTATVPSIQTPLASAAELADATNGNPQKFRAFMAPSVGPGRQFASASLWRLGAAHLTPTAVVGAPPVLAASPRQVQEFFERAKRTPQLAVTGILGSATPGLGYAFSTPGNTHGWAAYAETLLPKDRRSRVASNSAFSDLDYALYLGHSRRPGDLLVTSMKRLPITGRTASDVVPFGNSAFSLVVAPRGSLGGPFFRSLPWIIVGLGVLIALAAALQTDRIVRRRQHAEQLARVLDRVAAENRQLYTEQRSIAQTLQHALLPDALPELRGLQVSARYVPATSGIDVGGDWYDVIEVDDQRVLLVIGDVSGHGLRAATTMASLRHAALAYAAQDCAPSSVLAKLSDFVNSGEHDYFATVLCGLIEVDAHRLTVASAGHFAPLLLDENGGHFVEITVNVPIGVRRETQYRESTVSVPANATLVAFTDGLVERRGEVLDVGLTRLRDAATRQRVPLDDLLSNLARDLASDDHHDDTAIVGIEWQS
jgi:serine phosphatase RsbU (regulator of sigma subunit)